VIRVDVTRDRALIAFDVMLVTDEMDAWLELLELVAEIGPSAVLEALERDAEVEG
jgi:hypothetical protein